MRWLTLACGAVASFLAFGLGVSPVGAQPTPTTTSPKVTTTTSPKVTTTTPPVQTTTNAPVQTTTNAPVQTTTTVPVQTTTTAPVQTTTSGPPIAAQQPSETVTYCHRTDAVTNPYVLHTTAVDSIVTKGHSNHTGPVFPELDENGNWGDIIRPFDYDNGQQHFPGLNWDAEGAAVIAANCVVHETPIDPPPNETTIPTLPEETTIPTPPGETTSTVPGVTTTPTTPTAAETTTTTATASGVPTTSPGPGGPTTGSTIAPPTGSSPTTFATAPPTPPPVSALAAGEALPDPLPQVTAFVLAAHGEIVVLGVLSPDEVRTVYRELAARHLAHTGSETGALALVALLALVVGSGLLALSGWRRRTAGR